MYTVNHKKTWQFIFDYNWLILTDFYSFYIILIVKKNDTETIKIG